MDNSFIIRHVSGIRLPRRITVSRGSRYGRFREDVIGYIWQVSANSWRWEVRNSRSHDSRRGRATTKSAALTEFYRSYYR